jgi:hypothetical protein
MANFFKKMVMIPIDAVRDKRRINEGYVQIKSPPPRPPPPAEAAAAASSSSSSLQALINPPKKRRGLKKLKRNKIHPSPSKTSTPQKGKGWKRTFKL